MQISIKKDSGKMPILTIKDDKGNFYAYINGAFCNIKETDKFEKMFKEIKEEYREIY